MTDSSHEFGPFDGQVRGPILQGSDRNSEGHFLPGPVRAHPITARLLGDSNDAPPAPAPHVARAQQRARVAEKRRVFARHARFLAAVAGDKVGRNRSAA